MSSVLCLKLIVSGVPFLQVLLRMLTIFGCCPYGERQQPLLMLLLPIVFQTAQTMELGGYVFELPSLGWCPTMAAQQNFIQKMDKFLGVWYVQSSFGLEKLQGKARCIVVNYVKVNTPDPKDRHVLIQSRQFHVENNRWEALDGTAVQANKRSREGKFKVKFFLPIVGEFSDTYTIMSTDFSRYAVVYGCGTVWKLFHYECSWLMSRKQILTPEEEKEFYKITDEVLKNYDVLDPKEFIKVDQTDCDFSKILNKKPKTTPDHPQPKA